MDQLQELKDLLDQRDRCTDIDEWCLYQLACERVLSKLKRCFNSEDLAMTDLGYRVVSLGRI